MDKKAEESVSSLRHRMATQLLDWDKLDKVRFMGVRARDCSEVELLAIITRLVAFGEIVSWDVSLPQPIKEYQWPG